MLTSVSPHALKGYDISMNISAEIPLSKSNELEKMLIFGPLIINSHKICLPCMMIHCMRMVLTEH